MRRNIRLLEVIDAAIFSALSNVHKVVPGIVTAYHPSVAGKSPKTVDVQPALNDVRLDVVLGTRVSEPWPVIPQVPLGTPKGGGYVMNFALAPGDKVLLLSFDLDPTAHRTTGMQKDPVDTRRHGGAYWIALPFDITDPGGDADPGNALVVGQPSGVQVRISPSGVNIGGASPPDAAALASKVDAFIQAVMGWMPVAMDGGAALKTALGLAGFSSTSSTASGTVKITR